MSDRQAKYWICPNGEVHLVCIVGEGEQLSHEEWAESRRHSLEGLLDQGWVRVQHVVPQYSYVDYRHINAAQVQALRVLLRHAAAKTIIEVNGEARSFGSVEEAMGFVQVSVI